MKLAKLQNIINKVSGLSKREKLVLYGSIFFISLALFDRLIVSGFAQKIKSLDEEIASKKSQIRTNLRLIGQKNRIEIQRARYVTYLGSLESENEEFTALLKEIELIANKAGLNLKDMKPAGVKEQGDSRKYTVNLTCEGPMEKLALFIYQVETAKKLLTVERYEIEPQTEDSSAATSRMAISKLVIP